MPCLPSSGALTPTRLVWSSLRRGPRLLPTFPENLSEYVQRALTRLGGRDQNISPRDALR
jgi:hypothetical protein